MSSLLWRKAFTSTLIWLCLILFHLPPLKAYPSEKSILVKEQTPVHKTSAEMNPDMLIGERLFYGTASFESGSANCEQCHSTVSSDSLNWNPSAFDLSVWIKDRKFTDLIKAFDAPASEKMETAHNGIQLTPEEAGRIQLFLGYINHKGLAPHKPFPIRLILFFVFGLLMALALIDLIFTRYIKYRIIHALVLVIGLSMHLHMAIVMGAELSRTQHYAPDQPVKFSHKVHAGDNQIDCNYCHTGAFYGKSAGIPSTNVCTNCHNVIKTGRNSGKFEINKIYTALNQGKPIEWIRIHNLPDHVYFNHAQHVAVGKIACQQCHGPVETMEIMRQESDLSMGWCINCHRETKVPFTSNGYYSKNKKLLESLHAGTADSVTAAMAGGLDCMKCHY